SSDDQLFLLDRRGLIEECYFTFSYSPLRDESGAVGGVLSTCVETTRRVIGARRLETLRALAALPSQHNDVASVAAAAVQALEANALDFGYVALYLHDEARGHYEMVATSLHVADAGLLPAHVGPYESDVLPFARAQREGRLVLASAADAAIAQSPAGAGKLPVRDLAILPLALPGKSACQGFLAAGLSPHLAFDDAYHTFVETAAASIVAALNHADAFAQGARRAQVLEELDRAKTEFFSNVSHEFRTPITLMLAPAEAMLSAPQALPEPVLEGAQVIYRNGLRLLKLVNSLLDFSRIEAGRARGVFEPIDLAQHTVQLASMFRAAIDKAGLRLELDCPPLSEPVYVDADMWEKIVLNLLSNAFKFTLEGGIRVALAQRGGEVELRVSDTGVGISAQDLPHVFDRFYRARNMRARSYEGSGIGLALVNELVKLHGGEVRIDSTAGRGTDVTVRLRSGHAHLPQEQVQPRARVAGDVHRARAFVEEALRWLPEEGVAPQPDIVEWLGPRDDGPGAREGHVLVADDNADLRDYLRRLLEPHYRVTLAGDGAHALAVARRDPPDLIVSDVMMPVLDGIGLVKALRSDHSGARVPIILLSARAGEESRIEGLAAEADDYLVKPFSARELRARIDARFEVLRLQRENARREQQLLDEIDAGRQRAEAILAGINDALAIFDAQWRYTYVNEAAVRISRRPREELIGQVLWELYPHLQGSVFESQMRKVAQSGVPARFEYCYEPWQAWYDMRASVVPEGLSLLITDITEAKRAEQVLRDAQATLEAHVAERTAALAQSNRTLSAEVAERRRVERELRASEERFRLAFAHASVGVTIRDRAGRFVSANRAFCEMTGYSESELAVVDSQSLIHPEDRARNIAELRALVSGAKPGYVIEKRYVRKDGEIIWVRNSVSLVRDDPGQPLNLVAISEDITGRKRAVDELRASEARFRRLTTLSSDWYWEQDSEFRMVFLSKGIEKATGIPVEHVLGKRRWETGAIGLSEQDWEAHRSLLRSRQPFHDLEFAVVRPDGEARWMQISGEPVFDDQHVFIGYRGIGRDITERRRALLRLTESEARLQAFMSNSSSMMFIKDLQGRYLHANEAFARGLGTNVEAILHRIDEDLFPAEVAARLRANDALAASRKAAIQTEEMVPFVSGVRTSIVSKFPLFDADGSVVATGGIATDITERKQAQQALEDRERLLEGVLETLPVGVWIADRAGTLVHGNLAGRRIWGGERMVGIEQFGEYKAWWAGTDRLIAAHEWALARAIERGETSLNELIDIQCFDGTRKTILNSAVPLRDDLGAVAGAIVVNEDVTARRQIEAAVASIAAGV
ncbi:MAG TPA: PAS domain S-box protein, partial [Burkholderiales bacterium]